MLLPLPMSAQLCADSVIAGCFRELLPARFDSIEARVLMLAIFMQEAGGDGEIRHRKQVAGPARGIAQFEQRGGVHGVLTHAASRLHARAVCLLRAVAPTDGDVYLALAHDDFLAAAFARLLLWTDTAPLPKLGAVEEAWHYYQRNWQPGKPHPETWPDNYRAALKVYRP